MIRDSQANSAPQGPTPSVSLYRVQLLILMTSQTSTTMIWFMLAMIAYPEKQKKCQEELDRVIGSSRMPTFEDQDHLPYVNATVRELLRWRPAFPIGELLANLEVAYSVGNLNSCHKSTTLYDRGMYYLFSFVRYWRAWAHPTLFRMIGTKDSSFPKAHCVWPIFGTSFRIRNTMRKA